MKFLKNNIKVVIAFILGLILAGGIVYAATTARDVSYTTAKNENIKNVEEALNDLYSKRQITPEQVGKITTQDASYTFENDGYITGSMITSNGAGAMIYFNEKDNAHRYSIAPFDEAYYTPVSIYVPKGTTVYTRANYGVYDLTLYEFK